MNVKDGHMRAASTRRVRTDASPRLTRRAFLIAAAAWPALAWSGAVFGQSKKPVLIGWLSWGSRQSGERMRNEFKSELAALGWKEGSSYVLEERWAEGHVDRLQALAAELAAKKPALIIANPVPPASAAAKAAPKTPIVVVAGDPVSAGLVASHARPGGMITGLTSAITEISEKYLELLLAAAPKVQRVGFLFDRNAANVALLKENARRSVAQHKVEAQFAEVARPEEVEPALSRLAKEGAQALVVVGGAGLERQRIVVKFALTQRWPVVGGSGLAAGGALLSYGPDVPAMYRRAAYYVDRILKGTKPADLPIERPMKFETVLNMKTARALKLEISRELQLRVDRVIE